MYDNHSWLFVTVIFICCITQDVYAIRCPGPLAELSRCLAAHIGKNIAPGLGSETAQHTSAPHGGSVYVMSEGSVGEDQRHLPLYKVPAGSRTVVRLLIECNCAHLTNTSIVIIYRG